MASKQAPFQPIVKTLKVRVRDKHAQVLREMAGEVNHVWNWCNESTAHQWRVWNKWLSEFDLNNATAGASKFYQHIGSATIQEVVAVHAKCRKQFHTSKLQWRTCNPDNAKRKLGWVPFKSRAAVWRNGQVQFAGHHFRVWDSYGLSQYKFRAGSFVEDARGRWYFVVQVHVAPRCMARIGAPMVGVDLGLKDSATASDGSVCRSRRYRELESELGVQQRARNKGRVRSLHAKIKNRRKDDQHKFSTALVAKAGAIAVGGVKLPKSKSVLDASWASLKSMLDYKCQQAGIDYEVVDEAYTTQTCSSCGSNPASSPKGRTGLGVRRWQCDDCGASHDRDVNAAINIARRGRAWPSLAGIPCL